MVDHVRVACPTFNLQPKAPLLTKQKGEYAHCSKCDHIFLLKPLTSEKKLINFYANYPKTSLEWHQNDSEFYGRIYQSGIKHLAHTLVVLAC